MLKKELSIVSDDLYCSATQMSLSCTWTRAWCASQEAIADSLGRLWSNTSSCVEHRALRYNQQHGSHSSIQCPRPRQQPSLFALSAAMQTHPSHLAYCQMLDVHLDALPQNNPLSIVWLQTVAHKNGATFINQANHSPAIVLSTTALSEKFSSMAERSAQIGPVYSARFCLPLKCH